MPSRKQRRRREKLRRHEYEYVYVDEEGREVEVDPAEPSQRKEKKSDGRGRSTTGRGRRPGRQVQPPSWNRVAKRGLIFAPLMFLVINLLGRRLTVQQRVVQTLILLVFFVPFSYLMDTMLWRAYKRRTGITESPKPDRESPKPAKEELPREQPRRFWRR